MAATAIFLHFRPHRHRRFLTSTVRFYSSSYDNSIRVNLKKICSEIEQRKKKEVPSISGLALGETTRFSSQPPNEVLVEKYFHPNHMSFAEKQKLELKKVRDKFKGSESDCGSACVQGSGGCLYVKVSMDGAPYLRMIDLKTYHNYAELSMTLEKMFSCFTLGHPLSEGIKDGSECVLTYEDNDCDWMLVGDVPWEMFIDSCKRLRIMKTSKAIG